MVKEVPSYVCEKCGYFQLGQTSEERVKKHEQIPETGINDSLDGLITRCPGVFNVFRKVDTLNEKHEALYTWVQYHENTLEEVDIFPEELEKGFKETFGDPHFTSKHIINGVLLFDGRKRYQEVKPKEFARAVKLLKEKYPELYAETEFKRKPDLE
jgi:hypothetical protein